MPKGTEKVPGHPRFDSECFKYPTFAKSNRKDLFTTFEEKKSKQQCTLDLLPMSVNTPTYELKLSLMV